jgi:YVTN family beta-propeller protein
MKLKRLAACSVVALVSAAAFAAAVNYQLLKKVPLPGAGGWDYISVDDAARRIYISHATQVEVLDADSFSLVGTIPNTPGVHGIAIASEAGRGYISAGKSDAVVPFELKTLKPLPEIKVGKKPDAIIFEPLTKRIYVMNGDSNNITVLNASDGSLAGTIDLGGGPEFAVSDGKGNLYVNLEENNETLHIDVNAMKVKDRWPLAPCATPTSLAMDVENRRLFRRLPQPSLCGAERSSLAKSCSLRQSASVWTLGLSMPRLVLFIFPPATAKYSYSIRILPINIPCRRKSLR